jgi:addiction module HigA family antidote
MIPVHPGRILRREFEARELSADRLAIELKLPSGRIPLILGGKRGISADTALRLGQFFGNSARFWLNLQTAYELAVAEREIGARIREESEPAPAPA